MIAIDRDRRELVAEMHLRPIPLLPPPARIIQVLALLSPEDLHAVDVFLSNYADAAEDEAPRRDGRFSAGGITYLWERHTEALTISALLPGDAPVEAKAEAEAEAEAEALLSEVPGRVLRAIKIDLVRSEEEAERLVEAVGLSRADTVSGIVDAHRFWSDFRLREDGFGRLVVASPGSDTADLGRLVRDIQEMGNYRNLALLGLPLVRRKSGLLAELEAAAAALTLRLAENVDDRDALDELMQLSAQLSGLRSETAYRLGATVAYGRIVSERIDTLAPVAVPEFQTLAEFTNRRFLPALRTCENFSQRLEALSVRIEQASSLLRARIETRVHEQNGKLLHSLDETARRQLHLQHLVEGLSVFAVSYYAIGLLGYLLWVLPERVVPDHKFVVGMAVLPIMLFLAVMLRRKSRGDTHD